MENYFNQSANNCLEAKNNFNDVKSSSPSGFDGSTQQNMKPPTIKKIKSPEEVIKQQKTIQSFLMLFGGIAVLAGLITLLVSSFDIPYNITKWTAFLVLLVPVLGAVFTEATNKIDPVWRYAMSMLSVAAVVVFVFLFKFLFFPFRSVEAGCVLLCSGVALILLNTIYDVLLLPLAGQIFMLVSLLINEGVGNDVFPYLNNSGKIGFAVATIIALCAGAYNLMYFINKRKRGSNDVLSFALIIISAVLTMPIITSCESLISIPLVIAGGLAFLVFYLEKKKSHEELGLSYGLVGYSLLVSFLIEINMLGFSGEYVAKQVVSFILLAGCIGYGIYTKSKNIKNYMSIVCVILSVYSGVLDAYANHTLFSGLNYVALAGIMILCITLIYSGLHDDNKTDTIFGIVGGIISLLVTIFTKQISMQAKGALLLCLGTVVVIGAVMMSKRKTAELLSATTADKDRETEPTVTEEEVSTYEK